LPSTVAEQTPDGGSTPKSSGVTPSQAPDPNSKPEGPPTEVPSDPNQQDEARSKTRENESAVTMAQSGYRTIQNPPTTPNGKNPDYTIEGEYADCYAPRTDKTESVYSTVKQKVEDGQAEIIVVNLQDAPNVDASNLETMLKTYPISGLRQVFVLRDDQILKNIAF
jgi:Contact-dependent growth inhibition CdiA C-terminal domain